jgi:rSAM/selenodomain-associated transferase 2
MNNIPAAGCRRAVGQHAPADAALLGLSVVIPALNAARVLPAMLAGLGGVADIVVVDGGSADGTPDIAARHGARVIAAPRGRGVQLRAGVAAAQHAWLLLLHADTRLGSGWEAAVGAHIAAFPDRAGYFRFALDCSDPRARRLEKLVVWRCRVFALPYGDQGLLIHRDLLQQIGGIRPLALMEDVDLVRRLGRERVRPLDAAAVTSAERWLRDGWLRRSARNLVCLSLWFAGVPPRHIARLYR